MNRDQGKGQRSFQKVSKFSICIVSSLPKTLTFQDPFKTNQGQDFRVTTRAIRKNLSYIFRVHGKRIILTNVFLTFFFYNCVRNVMDNIVVRTISHITFREVSVEVSVVTQRTKGVNS